MSDEQMQIVRRGLDLLLASLRSGVPEDGLLELCAPDIRVDATRRVFNPDVYEGHAGVERSIRDTYEAWDDFRYENDRFIEVDERVLVIQTLAGRGPMSSAEVQLTGAMIWTVRDGLISFIEVFIDAREALEAVGVQDE